MKPRHGFSTRPYRPQWVRAVNGPLGRRIPRRWLERSDSSGNHNFWVIHTDSTKECPGRYLVRHWQVSSHGQVRKAVYPQLSATNLLEARALVPYEFEGVDRCDAEPLHWVLEIWY
jgi:hypothetical protein